MTILKVDVMRWNKKFQAFTEEYESLDLETKRRLEQEANFYELCLKSLLSKGVIREEAENLACDMAETIMKSLNAGDAE